MSRLLLLLGLAAAAGCERDLLEVPCPKASPGDLVVTEIGAHWVEMYNASSHGIDLGGAVLSLQRLMGGAAERILVRSAGLELDPGHYAVLGRAQDEFVFYSPGPYFDRTLPPGAVLRVESCDQVIDEVVYRRLPSQGTLAYDGAFVPDADSNDHADPNDPASSWCIDTGRDGTAGLGNRPC
jgi:hypothetical protein